MSLDIGDCSGADIDKFITFSLTPANATHAKAPLIAECLVSLKCELADGRLVSQ